MGNKYESIILSYMISNRTFQESMEAAIRDFVLNFRRAGEVLQERYQTGGVDAALAPHKLGKPLAAQQGTQEAKP